LVDLLSVFFDIEVTPEQQILHNPTALDLTTCGQLMSGDGATTMIRWVTSSHTVVTGQSNSDKRIKRMERAVRLAL
jgi:hypothetical protein